MTTIGFHTSNSIGYVSVADEDRSQPYDAVALDFYRSAAGTNDLCELQTVLREYVRNGNPVLREYVRAHYDFVVSVSRPMRDRWTGDFQATVYAPLENKSGKTSYQIIARVGTRVPRSSALQAFSQADRIARILRLPLNFGVVAGTTDRNALKTLEYGAMRDFKAYNPHFKLYPTRNELAWGRKVGREGRPHNTVPLSFWIAPKNTTVSKALWVHVETEGTDWKVTYFDSDREYKRVRGLTLSGALEIARIEWNRPHMSY
jgi:hypothetical protein